MTKSIKTIFFAFILPMVLLGSCNAVIRQTPSASTPLILPIKIPALTSTPPFTTIPLPNNTPSTWLQMPYDTQSWYLQDLNNESQVWGAPIVPQVAHWHPGPALINKAITGCLISIESGHGLPNDDLTYDDERITAGEYSISKRVFYKINHPEMIDFIVYNVLIDDGNYLLLKVPARDDDRTQCIFAAERIMLYDNDQLFHGNITAKFIEQGGKKFVEKECIALTPNDIHIRLRNLRIGIKIDKVVGCAVTDNWLNFCHPSSSQSINQTSSNNGNIDLHFKAFADSGYGYKFEIHYADHTYQQVEFLRSENLWCVYQILG